MKNSVTIAVIKTARSTRIADERIARKTTPVTAKHTKIKIFFFVTRLYEYGCSTAMYLSNVIPNKINVEVPSVIGNNICTLELLQSSLNLLLFYQKDWQDMKVSPKHQLPNLLQIE